MKKLLYPACFYPREDKPGAYTVVVPDLPACKKDPSAALGMTKREDGLSYVPFHPAAGANLRPFGVPSPRGEGCFYTSRHKILRLSSHIFR